MTRRTNRVNELLREEISELVQREIKDPRLGDGLISVTEVVVSPDLRHATVFISQLGGNPDHKEVLTALQHGAHFMHGELVKRLALRRVPELVFRYDISLERGARMATLINTVAVDTSGTVAVDTSGTVAVDASGTVAVDASGTVAVDASGTVAEPSGTAADRHETRTGPGGRTQA